MTTIADELLNDFEDDDDGTDDEQQRDEFFPSEDAASLSASAEGRPGNGHMELDGDEEEPDDDDADGAHATMESAEDEMETKARVERMQLRNVSDVRSVASLMKQLQPVIEVSLATSS